MQIDTSRERAQIVASVHAVLGPTNTGKTHMAMERMFTHKSGIIGFPLRLLARENYDRAVKLKGAAAVALVTGEEKILPPNAKYYLTTVESMPTDRAFDFAAIDEIQMCADPDRGHIFTDRLLHYRGLQETFFLGADTIRPIIRALVPQVEFQSRPRLSTLRYTGYKKLTRLKPRTCIVAFSTGDVYAIAEWVRRQSGGAAIVMGALSPRTRNAQVDMFQSGEVDYLVATDAVGMGLNMDVNHVALAATRKFDGRMMRDLIPAELAQIAGRAGRHMNDGTFGTTGDVSGLGTAAVERIEDHKFQPLKHIFWRQADLDFSSTENLLASLALAPEHKILRRARQADDEQVLATLLQDSTITDMTNTPDSIRLLWDVARIPDFRKIRTDEHPQLLGRIFGHLTKDSHQIPDDWMAERVKRVNQYDGDIDTLMARLAGIRMWTYVSHQATWLKDPQEWQQRTRAIEDRLSDVLHERLTQRFVDKRTTQLVKTLNTDEPLTAALADDGALDVEGHHVGHLVGFRFIAAESDTTLAAKVLDSAASQALRTKINERLSDLCADADAAFTFDQTGAIAWRGGNVARLVKGSSLLTPTAKAISTDLLDADHKARMETRLNQWAQSLVRDRLGLLIAAKDAPIDGVARGLVYQLTESLGALPRHEASAEIKGLDKEARQALRKLGVRIGRHLIYIPTLLRPAAVELSVLLWALFEGLEPLGPPPAGRVSLKREKHEPEGWLRAAGFRPAGTLFIRADMLERMAELAWKRMEEAKGPFIANEDFLALAGCGVDDLPGILKSLDFAPAKEEGKWQTQSSARARTQNKGPNKGPKKSGAPAKPKPAKAPEPKIDPDSPFAMLQALKLKA